MSTRKKLSINAIKKAKNERLLTMITAYDALFATLFEESADIILVGDSLNMSFNGKSDTLSTIFCCNYLELTDVAMEQEKQIKSGKKVSER